MRQKQDFSRTCQTGALGTSSSEVSTPLSESGEMDDQEAIISFPSWGSGPRAGSADGRGSQRPEQVAFDRRELTAILGLYGNKVATGEWRDYAMEFGRDTAVFSVFRRSSEVPLYRIVKDPALSRRQGMYAVIAQGGLILKRGHDLAQVLRVLMKQPKLTTV